MTGASLVVRGGTVVTPDGVVVGDVSIVDGRISAVGAAPNDDDCESLDANGCWVAPGFIDTQINGAHGIDVTTDPDRVGELAAHLAQYGVTSFLPTIVTSSDDTRRRALDGWAARGERPTGHARALGLHLEGPMLSPAHCGAHRADLLQHPATTPWREWTRDGGVVMVTMAPELPGALDVIRQLVGRGVVVAVGHTDASAAEVAAGLAAGATAVTHLFNAMRPFAHRDPGPIGITLTDDAVVAGLIVDGTHVDPVAVRMAWRCLGPDRTMLVTDAVAAMGIPAGRDRPGAVDGGSSPPGAGVRTADGTLAGSDVSLERAVRNLVAWTGCSVPDALRTVTATPAGLLGLADRGRLDSGALGDVTVLDEQLGVVATVIGGVVAWRSVDTVAP